MQRKSASPDETAVFFLLRHNIFQSSSFFSSKTIGIDATFKFRYIHEHHNSFTIVRRLLRYLQDRDYQNGLDDIVCEAIQMYIKV